MTPMLLIAPAAISVITAILAALISVTDKIVNNYGEVTIDINDGKKELQVTGGTALLTTLAEQEIFIPSACGGRGSCGACKTKVTSDVGPHLPTETPYLSKKEMAENVRLSCQIKLKSDINIEIPEYLFNIKKFDGVVESIKDVTHDIKEVLIKLPEGEEIDFQAGQYVQIVVPPYNKIKEHTQRAYSMSSRPSDKNHVEMLIRLVPGGIATTYVHEMLQEKQPLQVIGPFGDFFVRETNAAMICVAGGSGMAPFKAILYDMLEKGKTDRDVWYFFGARTTKDLYYLDELKELEQKWNRFHFISALSEPEPEYTGESGLITEVLENYLENKIPKDQAKEGYLCGSPGMLDACMNVMRKFDMAEDKIYFDKFA